jgi:hypothetical protein
MQILILETEEVDSRSAEGKPQLSSCRVTSKLIPIFLQGCSLVVTPEQPKEIQL